MKNNPLHELLQQQGFVILDGALATELERRGADLQDDLWSAKMLLENPEMIRRLHYDYFVAGADVAITASYQASYEGFMRRGLTRAQAKALMQLSVDLARDARDEFWDDPQHRQGRQRPLVAASIGCYGAYLADGSEYRGDYALSKQELMDWHRPRMEALIEAAPDLLACETIPLQREGEALVELLTEFPETQAWISYSCCDEAHVCHGEQFADAVAAVSASAQVVAVGVNCTPPRFVESLLLAARSATDRPLLAYPNSGETWDNENMCWVGGTGVTNFAQPARIWHAAGARILGGCCRTSPADIAIIRRALQGTNGEL